MSKKDAPLPLSKAESKAEGTNRVAREFIQAEVDERARKTEKLRKARLDKEAADKAAPPEPPAKRTRKTRRTPTSD